MRRHKTDASAIKNATVSLTAAPLARVASARLLGLDAGDWSMIVLGLVLSGSVLALV
jgi:hypothetical protein